MTHLDNEGEFELCCCGLGRVEMGLWDRGLSIPLSLPENQAGRGMGSWNKGNLSPLNPMLCPLLLATLLPTLTDCWARCFPAWPSCVVWPEPKDKCCLQPEPPLLLLSKQVQEEQGVQHYEEEAFGSWPGGNPPLEQGLKGRLGL